MAMHPCANRASAKQRFARSALSALTIVPLAAASAAARSSDSAIRISASRLLESKRQFVASAEPPARHGCSMPVHNWRMAPKPFGG